MTTVTKISLFNKIKNSKPITFINKILSSAWGIGILGFITLLAHIFAIELALYIFVAIYTVYVCIFSDDLLPLMPLFIFCYISPSKNNNPALTTNSVFYNQSGIVILVILAICIPAILVRIGFDKNMGYKKLFTQKRSLLSGICILSFLFFVCLFCSEYY